MGLSSVEQLLIEELKSLLDGKVDLGLSVHKKDNILDTSNAFQLLHENINQQFHLDTTDLPHHDGICAAFTKVHSYKYLDDPKFIEDLRKEFTGQAIPAEEMTAALAIVEKIRNKIASGKNKEFQEKDAGWHPELDEVLAAAQPE